MCDIKYCWRSYGYDGKGFIGCFAYYILNKIIEPNTTGYNVIPKKKIITSRICGVLLFYLYIK